MKVGDRFKVQAYVMPDYIKCTVFTVTEVKRIKCKSIPDYKRLIGKGDNAALIDVPEKFAIIHTEEKI
jgi:hypothetical protein